MKIKKPTVNASYRVNSVESLLSTTRRIVSRNYVAEFNKRVLNSRLNGLVNIKTIADDATDFTYTPKIRRRMVMGDANPASCMSTPMPVNRAGVDELWGKTEEHESSFQLCVKDCKADSIQSLILENLADVSDVLVSHLWSKFWFGNPQRLQYGLLNHELIQVVESPPNGTGGSSKWKDKTNSQIMKEIRTYVKYMKNPRILISEEVYNEALATGDIDTGTERGCALRINCIKQMLLDQPDVNVTANTRFEMLEELDTLDLYAGSNTVMIYDADAIVLTSSGPILLEASAVSPKMVEQILSINTGGVEIEYMDSAFIITGV